MKNIEAYLGGNAYPGRGIMLGRSPDGRKAIIAYFIMGRSENSRNRVFTRVEGGIRTEAWDPSKLKDPSLIIYAPVRVLDSSTIVTNGDQTDTIFDFMIEGKSFEDALRTRCFEPDAPNYTPRISGILTLSENDFSYKLSILRSDNGNPAQCLRCFYEYARPVAGEGHIIHTYRCDGSPIPSFEGEPVSLEMYDDIDRCTAALWSSLDEGNKVSLFVRYIDVAAGIADTRIINKNNGGARK